MTEDEAISEIRSGASNATLLVDLGPDERVWALGAVGGIDGLFEALKDAVQIQAHGDSGWLVIVPGEWSMDEGRYITGATYIEFDRRLAIVHIAIC